MQITRKARANHTGYLTVAQLDEFIADLRANEVPSDAKVEVKHHLGQRDEPSWSIEVSW